MIIPDRPNLRWVPTRPWPGPGTAGYGCSRSWTTTPGGLGARRKVGDRFAALQPVYDAFVDRWAASARTWPRPVVAARLGAAIPLRPLPGLDRPAGHQRRRRVPWRAEDRRLRRAMDPHPQRAVLVGRPARQRQPTPPRGDRLRLDLQHSVVDRSDTATAPKEAYQPHHDRGGMIRWTSELSNNRALVHTPALRAAYHRITRTSGCYNGSGPGQPKVTLHAGFWVAKVVVNQGRAFMASRTRRR